LVTFGISPTRPDTGYGYIKRGEPLDFNGAYRAAQFLEKPPLARAEAFLQEGGYYWNSGIFMFRRGLLLDAFARHLPETYAVLQRLRGEGETAALEDLYQQVPDISIDHGIMERSAQVAVVPVDMGWSDVGTWGALVELFPKDAQGNVTLGRTLDLESRNCLIYAQDRLVATLGLNDTVVVDTPDATLVCPMSRVQDVKNLVAEMSQRQMVESQFPLTVERPWGHYTVIESGPDYKVKRIVVHPGKRLSLQLHHHRAEHWVVVQGTALVTIGQEKKLMASNESVFVPLKTPHRLENPGTEPVRIIEVQTGSYLEEDDIIRLDDDFWRPTEELK
jgi:mannose-1-phosphate guanylyltransferase/mannose-6-phosphate isomerase